MEKTVETEREKRIREVIGKLIAKIEESLTRLHDAKGNRDGRSALWAVYNVWNSSEYTALEKIVKEKKE